jgi:hypothetical protein
MKAFFVLCFSGCLFAQTQFEASGQTVPFTLTAGAKAAWDHTATAIKNPIVATRNEITFSVFRNPSFGTVVFAAAGMKPGTEAKITIYSINGKIADMLLLNGVNTIELKNRLVNGIYYARLEIAGKMVKTSTFLVMR